MTTLAPPALSFFVRGVPVTKGSLVAVSRNRADGSSYATLFEQSGAKLTEWRALIATGAKRAMGREMPFSGPLYVQLRFFFPRPPSHSKAQRAIPWVYGNHRYDVDKLCRAALDAIGDAAIWKDDSQVAVLHSDKRYCDEDERPGVRIEVSSL